MVKPFFEFAGEFAGLRFGQFQQIHTVNLISSTNVRPCTQKRFSSLGHGQSSLGMSPNVWSQCDMVQAANRPESYDSMNLGLRAA